MNESILINNSVLRLLQLMCKRKREKDEEKAVPLSFYGALSILWLCSAIRRCVSLSPSQSSAVCILRVCVRARISVPSVYFGNPGGFGPTPRSLNALWHGEALCPGD